jgi:hypothetical protein
MTVDEAQVEEFVGQALADASGFTTCLLAGLGDRDDGICR